MKIAIAADHGGFEQKQELAAYLRKNGYEVADFGPSDSERVDYPDYAKPVATAVAEGDAVFGVLVCGTGIGMQIAANKVDGVRAANVTTPEFAALAREHNDANVVTLSGRFVDQETNEHILDTFLTTGFGGDRHADRVDKIMQLEK